MNILITGKNGQLGSEIQHLSSNYTSFTFIYTDVIELDITEAELVDHFFKDNSIDLVINCAAYTAVDNAEDDFDLVNKVNNIAVKNLVEACIKYQAKIIHVSTDYVFDGSSNVPYIEADAISPIGVYGRTKRSGEEQLLNAAVSGIIVRTSWVYSSFGNNFVKTMIRLGQDKESLNVIFDQVGTPTYARDLARCCLDIAIQTENWPAAPEVFHYSNEGVCSWYDFATSIMEIKKINCKLFPIETKDYPTKSKRPHYSVLNKSKIKAKFNMEIPYWKISLEQCLAETPIDK
jgi:dTDP-4-dehydrorhamnose reductase